MRNEVFEKICRHTSVIGLKGGKDTRLKAESGGQRAIYSLDFTMFEAIFREMCLDKNLVLIA